MRAFTSCRLNLSFLCSVLLLVSGTNDVAAAQDNVPRRGEALFTAADPSGGRVSGATITVTRGSQTRTVTTSSDGTARVRDLEPGEWSVRVVSDGFEPWTQTVTIRDLATDVPVVLAIAGLQETVGVEAATPLASIPLDRQATGGTRLDIPVRDLPASLTIMTQEIMVERGARSATEAVEHTVGMNADISVGAGINYSTRGFASSTSGGNVMVLFDGIAHARAGSADRRTVDTFLLDRVEVLKGPASLLFGQSAMGGAINHVSKEPQSRFGGEALLSYGSFGTSRLGLGGTTPIGRQLSARVDISRSDTDGYVLRSGQTLDGAAGAVRWAPAPSFSLRTSGTYMSEDTHSYYGTPLVRGQIDPRMRRNNYDMRDSFNRSYNSWGNVRVNAALARGWLIENQSFFTTLRQDRRNMRGYVYNERTDKVDVQTYFLSQRNNLLTGNRFDARNTFIIGGRPVNVTGGGEIQRSRSQTSGFSASTAIRFSVDPFDPEPIFDVKLPNLPSRYDVIVTTATYVETAVEATTRTKLVTGLRWEHIGLDLTNTRVDPSMNAKTAHTPLTGRVGAVFALTPEANVYGSYSRAVEPSTSNEGLDGSGRQYTLSPGRQWEVGSKATILDGRLDATLAFYDIVKSDILTTSIVDNLVTAQQIGRQISRGVELAAVVRPLPSFTLSGDISRTHAEFADFTEIVNGRNVSRDGNVPRNVPATVANISPMLRIGAFDLSSRLRYVSDHWDDDANTLMIPGYSTVEAALAYRVGGGRYRVTGRVRNLTDELYSNGSFGNTSQRRLAAPRSFDVTVAVRY